MGFFNWVGMGNDDSEKNSDSRVDEKSKKTMAEQQQVLSGLKELNAELGRANSADDARMRNAERLIKEGSGL
jgi:hypothetical protein